VQPTVSDVVINGGSPIVAGTGSVTFTVSLNPSHPTGVKAAELDLFRGLGSWLLVDDTNGVSWLDCTAVSATTSHCEGTITGYVVEADHRPVDHSINLLCSNGQAGNWDVRVGAVAGVDSRLWNRGQWLGGLPVAGQGGRPQPAALGLVRLAAALRVISLWSTATT